MKNMQLNTTHLNQTTIRYYPSLSMSYDTQPRNKVGLFYSCWDHTEIYSVKEIR